MKSKNSRKMALVLVIALMPMFTNGCILTTLLGGAGRLVGGAVGAAGNLLGAGVNGVGRLLGAADRGPIASAPRIGGVPQSVPGSDRSLGGDDQPLAGPLTSGLPGDEGCAS